MTLLEDQRQGAGRDRAQLIRLMISRQASERSWMIYRAGRRIKRAALLLRVRRGWTGSLPRGDAKRHGSSLRIASPGQQRAIGADLFQQPSADELIHGLSNRFARNVCR